LIEAATMRSATCDPALLSQFISGTLAPEAEREVVDHLTVCSACQGEVERLAGGASWFERAKLFLSPEREECWPTTSIILPPKDPAYDDSADRDSAADDFDDEVASPPISLDFLAPTDDLHSLGRVGTYEVMGVVGRGGTGIVLKAFDAALDRFVAIKVLSPSLAACAAARRRFARESQAAAAVVHEHVVPIHAVSEHQGLPYIVMQYVAGRSLQQRLDKRGPLALREILRIGLQTASGLAAAHAQGLIHRDVKPANILLENGVERVLVSDFGLARTMDDASLTCSGVIAGTPQYMAPEQARGEGVDYRTDLFSLGSVLYALATGHSPFRAETTMGVLHRICKESPRPIQDINPEIPHWFSAIVARLHAKNPAKRYGSAADVAELLQRHLARLQAPSSDPRFAVAEKIRSTRAWFARRRHLALITAGVAVALAIGGTPVVQRIWPPAGANGAAAASTVHQGSVAAGASIADERQSDVVWSQSVSDVRSRLTRVEDELHASTVPPDIVGHEMDSIRGRLEEINKLFQNDANVPGVSR
jgi:serine/threonine-protein kinase